MIVIIFEVIPKIGMADDYLNMAEALRADLAAMEGFVSIERFESLSQPGKFLSLSAWKGEEAVAMWRKHKGHRTEQALGRDKIFESYRLRVASIIRDYGMFDRGEVPEE